MKGRTFKFSDVVWQVSTQGFESQRNFREKNPICWKKTHLEVMHHILLEMLHVGLELTSWSWLVILWTTSLYRPIHQLCIPVYDWLVVLSVLSHFVDDPFCPQMGSSLIMCMLKIVQKSVLQWDVPWLPAFLETSSNLTIFEWESFQKTIKHFRWMMGVTCGTPRCWKLRWGWRPLKVEYSSLKEEDFYFPS